MLTQWSETCQPPTDRNVKVQTPPLQIFSTQLGIPHSVSAAYASTVQFTVLSLCPFLIGFTVHVRALGDFQVDSCRKPLSYELSWDLSCVWQWVRKAQPTLFPPAFRHSLPCILDAIVSGCLSPCGYLCPVVLPLPTTSSLTVGTQL